MWNVTKPIPHFLLRGRPYSRVRLFSGGIPRWLLVQYRFFLSVPLIRRFLRRERLLEGKVPCPLPMFCNIRPPRRPFLNRVAGFPLGPGGGIMEDDLARTPLPGLPHDVTVPVVRNLTFSNHLAFLQNPSPLGLIPFVLTKGRAWASGKGVQHT